MKCQNINRTKILTMLLLTFFISSCKEFLKVDAPKTQIVSSAIFSSDLTARSAMNGIYSEMSSSSAAFSGGNGSISLIASITSDELNQYGFDADKSAFYTNSLAPNNSYLLTSIWTPIYKYIYNANSVIDGLNNASGLTPNLKKQLEGEAKFLRAFCHFYLVNLFGNVPLVMTTDYRVNNVISRSSTVEVYAQIVKDLQDAQSLLAKDYSFSASERTVPNYWVATSLLARVYLYNKEWKNAEDQATLVIGNTVLYKLNELNVTFLKNSNEAIWQLMPVIPGFNTQDAQALRAPGSSNVSPIDISQYLLSSFEKKDNRRTAWVDSITNLGTKYYFPRKYKQALSNAPLTEYQMVLRLAEQYLIRAEARNEQNNLDGAKEDLNAVRKRAGLDDTNATDKLSLEQAIANERFVELFTEWGHRWFDLKRTGKATTALSSIKSPNWDVNDQLWPVPELELNNNPNLKPQNPGY